MLQLAGGLVRSGLWWGVVCVVNNWRPQLWLVMMV
jgi:hypothetical protein